MFQGQGESVVDIRLKRKDRTYRPNVSLFRGCASLYVFVLCLHPEGSTKLLDYRTVLVKRFV